eukprot:172294-Prorocentrum_minimum.AAC.1
MSTCRSGAPAESAKSTPRTPPSAPRCVPLEAPSASAGYSIIKGNHKRTVLTNYQLGVPRIASGGAIPACHI